MVFVVMMDVFVWGKSCSPFLNHCDFLPWKNQLCKLVVSVLCEFLEKIVVEIPVLLIAVFLTHSASGKKHSVLYWISWRDFLIKISKIYSLGGEKPKQETKSLAMGHVA